MSSSNEDNTFSVFANILKPEDNDRVVNELKSTATALEEQEEEESRKAKKES
ncbi:hypothetical protein H0H87_001193 [Tephrocybe sp. NHM501043]|nr:hypothetical protein H0H87_001193 [Tephrocybe sp. NHM501043]